MQKTLAHDEEINELTSGQQSQIQTIENNVAFSTTEVAVRPNWGCCEDMRRLLADLCNQVLWRQFKIGSRSIAIKLRMTAAVPHTAPIFVFKSSDWIRQQKHHLGFIRTNLLYHPHLHFMVIIVTTDSSSSLDAKKWAGYVKASGPLLPVSSVCLMFFFII